MNFSIHFIAPTFILLQNESLFVQQLIEVLAYFTITLQSDKEKAEKFVELDYNVYVYVWLRPKPTSKGTESHFK